MLFWLSKKMAVFELNTEAPGIGLADEVAPSIVKFPPAQIGILLSAIA